MTQPTDEQTIEAEIWVACVDGLRDWTPLEREWIQSHSIEEALLQWWESNASEGCWTDLNHEFMTQAARNYPWFQQKKTAQLSNIQNPHDPEFQRQFAAFLRGKPVSDAFLTELETRTAKLIAGLESHEQDDISTKSLSRSGADLLQTEER